MQLPEWPQIRGSVEVKDLIGKECTCVFNIPPEDWPIEGYPAWVIVDDVDMPMVCMRSKFSGPSIWVNASIIKTIRATDRTTK